MWSEHHLQEPGPLSSDKVIYIAPGTDLPDIISMLDDEGVIDSPLILNLALLVEGNRSPRQGGRISVQAERQHARGHRHARQGQANSHSVTIPEGLTSEQIVDRLRANDLLLGDIRETPPEGSLLPETYEVPRGMSRADLVRRMQEDDKKLVAQIWSRRASDLALHSPYELVTLASIVEKETGKADERPHRRGFPQPITNGCGCNPTRPRLWPGCGEGHAAIRSSAPKSRNPRPTTPT